MGTARTAEKKRMLGGKMRNFMIDRGADLEQKGNRDCFYKKTELMSGERVAGATSLQEVLGVLYSICMIAYPDISVKGIRCLSLCESNQSRISIHLL